MLPAKVLPDPSQVWQPTLPGFDKGFNPVCSSVEPPPLLRAAAGIFSRWYRVMKEAMGREKERQMAYKEANNIKKKAKVPSKPLELTDAGCAIAEMSACLTRDLFGDRLADYASQCFSRAVETADMRSFKIRLLMLKARDSLTGIDKINFASYLQEYITKSEEDAGCIPYPGPRRMSKAEQAYKALRDRMKSRGLLFDPNGDIAEGEKGGRQEAKQEAKQGGKQGDRQDIYIPKKSLNLSVVTVTKDFSFNSIGVICKDKARKEYESEAEIVSDMKSGAINAYKTPEDVLEGMNKGLLTPSEAIMFIGAISRVLEDENGGGSARGLRVSRGRRTNGSNGNKSRRSKSPSKAKWDISDISESEYGRDESGDTSDPGDTMDGVDDTRSVSCYNPDGFCGGYSGYGSASGMLDDLSEEE